jgi:hypothetical protein
MKTNNKKDKKSDRQKAVENMIDELFGKDKSIEPIQGGIIRPRCRKCGGTVHESGTGIIRMVCSKCGEIYEEPVYR